MSHTTDDFPAKLIYQPVAGFAEQVASKAPAPGGGSAAALSGALGAALLTMVANLTVGKKKYVDVAETFTDLRSKTEELRTQLTRQIDADTEAFQKFRVAGRLPDTDAKLAAKKEKAMAEAGAETVRVPAETMDLCLKTLHYAPQVARDGNENCVSDAATGAEMLLAGWEGAANNVLINLLGRTDAEAADDRSRVMAARKEGRAILEEVRGIVDGKLGG